jgi:hypothetical protein
VEHHSDGRGQQDGILPYRRSGQRILHQEHLGLGFLHRNIDFDVGGMHVGLLIYEWCC